MKRLGVLCIASALFLAVWLWAPAVWAQMGRGMGGSMMGQGQGMMMHGMDGQQAGCPMMGAGGRGGMDGMRGRDGMQGAMLMKPFHRWSNLLMAHADEIGLDANQINQLDQMITQHTQQAIQTRAEIQSLRVELQKALRTPPVNIQNVEKTLQTIHRELFNLQMDGIRLYADILKRLSPQQTQAMQEIIGTPFPPPWEKMKSRKVGPHHGRKGSMRQPGASGQEE